MLLWSHGICLLDPAQTLPLWTSNPLKRVTVRAKVNQKRKKVLGSLLFAQFMIFHNVLLAEWVQICCIV
ncbi:hypothetical protein AB205_0215300 [Aquarana catesbeiana]|uniref:Uncharacterized protein n=1 Tax=Aquarana catesbeiana TaxID=8400 RepID=A0A2G9SD88_AQUCT|nr:hypothetical protein AB205_0215300 [Aquarana catesbeiana]